MPSPPPDAGRSGPSGTLRPVVGVAALVLAADALTKWIVRESFYLGQSVDVVGEMVRLTYILNPGAAFGLHVGEHSRWVFGSLAVAAAAVLLAVAWQTPREDRLRLTALGLVLGGAMGNLVDRVRHAGGVVDFLDVGFGALRWPVFNVADVGVTMGAFLLVLVLWEDGAPGASGASEPRERAQAGDAGQRGEMCEGEPGRPGGPGRPGSRAAAGD